MQVVHETLLLEPEHWVLTTLPERKQHLHRATEDPYTAQYNQTALEGVCSMIEYVCHVVNYNCSHCYLAADMSRPHFLFTVPSGGSLMIRFFFLQSVSCIHKL